MSERDRPGFSPSFSKEVEAILAIAASGGFAHPMEFRVNLAKAGVYFLDNIPAPEFESPPGDDEDLEEATDG